MGGPSGSMLLFQIAAIGAESLGPEGPPTQAQASGRKALAQKHAHRGREGPPTAAGYLPTRPSTWCWNRHMRTTSW
ncbi:DUF6053 domain-containing protein [Lysobacter enzymogenes]|uniref:DUF6053 domain-containing protein n=1 Tax=Lysobacter enzymogenes TaxID=69 RepID=UPI00374A4919